MKARISQIYLLLICIFLASGCTSSPSPTTRPPVTTTGPLVTSTVTPEINPSQVTTPTLTRTIKPRQANVIKPESTLTPSPTRTITPSATLTPSPLPTLAPTEAQAQILDLLQNNAGCRLPCWWGFTPGVTHWEDAKRFLETFAKIVDFPGLPTDKIYNPEITIPVPEKIHPLKYLRYTYYTADGDNGKVIKQISASSGDVPNYRLPPILSEYGQPDEIWFQTSAGSGSSKDVPFKIVLFYSSHSFAVEYSMRVPLRMPIIGCPQQAKSPWFILWSAKDEKIYTDLAMETHNFGSGLDYPYISLEQATGMSVETFYDTFKNEGNTTCLETPLELWLAEGQTVISTSVKTATP